MINVSCNRHVQIKCKLPCMFPVLYRLMKKDELSSESVLRMPCPFRNAILVDPSVIAVPSFTDVCDILETTWRRLAPQQQQRYLATRRRPGIRLKCRSQIVQSYCNRHFVFGRNYKKQICFGQTNILTIQYA